MLHRLNNGEPIPMGISWAYRRDEPVRVLIVYFRAGTTIRSVTMYRRVFKEAPVDKIPEAK